MGDRANIAIVTGQRITGNSADAEPERVILYTHWGGEEVPAIVQEALKAGTDRWDDPPYLARIVFDVLTANAPRSTGFGISASIGDNERHIIELDPESQQVKVYPPTFEVSEMTAPISAFSFQEYSEIPNISWDALAKASTVPGS